MNQKDKAIAYQIFLYLAALFITSLVVSNLIFQKFFYWYPIDTNVFGIPLFELSVGILPYPITFLITDLISEIFGQKKANQVVVAGIFASFFSIGILLLTDFVPAIPSSPIGDETFSQVFSLSPLAVLASMIAYLCAQFVDIRIYHFWKKKTQGKQLWLRNNFSTFTSQFLDTFTVILLLCVFQILPWNMFTWSMTKRNGEQITLMCPIQYLTYVFIFRNTNHCSMTTRYKHSSIRTVVAK